MHTSEGPSCAQSLMLLTQVLPNYALQRQPKQEQDKPTAHCDSRAAMCSGASLKNGPAKLNALHYLDLGGLYRGAS